MRPASMVRSAFPSAFHRALHRALRRRHLGVLLVGALGLAACGGITRPALQVNGAEYSQSDLKADLVVVAGLGADRTAGTAAGTATTKAKSFTGDQTAQLLTNELYGRIIHQLFAAKKLKLPTGLDQKLLIGAATSVGGLATFKSLPQRFQDKAVHRQGEIEALKIDAAKGQDPKKYFDAHKADFTDTCVSHVLVPTKAEAVAARARIDKGETFEAVAKGVSTDTGSKAQGGSLGCGNVTQFVAEFAAAAQALKVDEVSQPVQTQFGFHVIKVTKRTVAAYDAKQKAAVLAKIDEASSGKLGEELSNLLKAAKVTVDPAFGTYVSDAGRGLPEIKAPGFKAAVGAQAPAAAQATSP